MDNVRLSANEKGIRVLSKMDDPISRGFTMYGDPVRLEQVLSNLLVNAVKFTPSGGTVEVSGQVSDSLVSLRVADTGIGIGPEFLPCLFDRFSQADESLRKDRGLGLGLTISRHIVELHGGRIFAMSQGPGKGCSFTIELPIADIQPTNLPDQASAPHHREQAVRALDHLTIVAVDDNADARAF